MPTATMLRPQDKQFAKEYVANGGNGRQAVLKVFDIENENSADVKASRLLSNDKVKKTIEEEAAQLNITHSTILQDFKQITAHKPENVSADAFLKANIELAKLLNMYPGSKHTNLNLSLKGNINNMTSKEAKETLKKIREDNDSVLQDTEDDTITPIDTE